MRSVRCMPGPLGGLFTMMRLKKKRGPFGPRSISEQLWQNYVRPHHLVVFVLDNVAVPYIQAGDVERCLDPRDLAWIGYDRVLVARLSSLRRGDRAGYAEQRIEDLAVHDLKAHEVKMDRMGIPREVINFPRLGVSFGGGLRDVDRQYSAAREG